MKKFELKDKNFFIILTIVIILVIFFLIVGIKSMYKLRVFDKIYANADSISSIENYTMKVKAQGDFESTTTIYYKNGVGKAIEKNGNYTWTDGAVVYVVDKENKTAVRTEAKEAYRSIISKDTLVGMIPGYAGNNFDRIKVELNLSTKIKSRSMYDQEYYVIYSDNGEQQKTLWINKATLLPSQATVTVNGNTFTSNYEISFSNVKNEDIALDDLSDYAITYNYEKTEEPVEENTNTISENIVEE